MSEEIFNEDCEQVFSVNEEEQEVFPIGTNTIQDNGERVIHTLNGTFVLKRIDLDKTNIDDEEIIFKSNAKMYRFDETEGWKDRGVGELKFLKNKNNGKIRIKMVRDKILKLCANHFLTPQMELELSPTNDRTWIYTTQCDYSYEKPERVTIGIKFSTKELCNNFYEKFEECKKSLLDNPSETPQ